MSRDNSHLIQKKWNGFTHAFFTALSAAISIKDVFRVALKESAKSAKATGKLWSERFCCVCVDV